MGNRLSGNATCRNRIRYCMIFPKKDNRVSAVENTLDLSVMVTVGKAKFLLMLQGQTIEHYVMPVRASHERGTEEAVYRKTTSDF